MFVINMCISFDQIISNVWFQKFCESTATPLEFLNSLAQCLGRVAVPPDLSCSLANALYAAVPPGRGGRLSNVLRSRTLDISPKNIKTKFFRIFAR